MLAALGLAGLTLGYAVPVATAAQAFAEDRWALDQVSVPTFAHPQLADDAGSARGGERDASPGASRDADAGGADAGGAAAQDKGDARRSCRRSGR